MKLNYKQGDYLNKEGFIFVARKSGKLSKDYPEFRFAKKKEIEEWNQHHCSAILEHRLRLVQLEQSIKNHKLEIRRLRKLLLPNT